MKFCRELSLISFLLLDPKIKNTLSRLVVLEEFKRQFELRKHMPGLKPAAPPWTFNSTAVFTRLDAFLKRLTDIEWLFDTVLEFSKLEKIEIGGILGRSLSVRIINVFKEFQSLFVSFTMRASDVLEPDDKSFVDDCNKFTESITDLDSKLAAILCQAFDDCGNLESIFKVGKSTTFSFFFFFFFCIFISENHMNLTELFVKDILFFS